MTIHHHTDEAPFRHRFVVVDEGVAYLDGNSLGRLPKATKQLIDEMVSIEWGQQLIGSWNRSWLPIAKRIGDKIAALIGASPERS